MTQEFYTKFTELMLDAENSKLAYHKALAAFNTACNKGDSIIAEQQRTLAIEAVGRSFDCIWAISTLMRQNGIPML